MIINSQSTSHHMKHNYTQSSGRIGRKKGDLILLGISNSFKFTHLFFISLQDAVIFMHRVLHLFSFFFFSGKRGKSDLIPPGCV